MGQFKGKVRDDYLDLVVKFPLTSLKSEEQFQAAQAVLDELFAKGKLTAGLEPLNDSAVRQSAHELVGGDLLQYRGVTIHVIELFAALRD